MGKELPILPFTAQPAEAAAENFLYSRVFCQKENSPPLRLLLEFLKSRGQSPIPPSNLDEAALDEWAWVQVTLGYDKARKPVQIFCIRDRGTYRDVFEQEQKQFLDILNAYDDIEASIATEFVNRARFILTTRVDPGDITDEGYDFNGWILEFYQEHCNGLVEVDGKGFYSPKGELIVDLSPNEEE
ncbi:MAG TPA: hypothetical protein VKP13_03560 [Nitrospira sp.]|nr:hypothetical protein [Nitrospira sp.]